MRSKGRNIFAAVVVSMFAVATIGLAVNSVPTEYDFETGLDGDSVIGSNGWVAADADAAVLSAETYTYSGTLPLTNSAHSKVLNITSDVTNEISSTSGALVYVDTMIDARPWDQETAPEPPADAQTAAYVNTNGNLVVWNQNESASNVWTVLGDTSITTGDWARLTFKMGYDGASAVDFVQTFSVILDGVTITNAVAHGTEKDMFKMAQSGTAISSVAFAGTAKIDDFQYTSTDPNPSAPTETDNGVPYTWLTDNGLGTDDTTDTDGDGTLEWEEYVAGTDPNNTNNVFEVLDVIYADGSNAVVFYATDDNVSDPVTIFRATDLLLENWVDQNANITRDASGTNTWWDTTPPAGVPSFYKPVIIWNP